MLARGMAGRERDHGVRLHFPHPQSEAPSKVLVKGASTNMGKFTLASAPSGVVL